MIRAAALALAFAIAAPSPTFAQTMPANVAAIAAEADQMDAIARLREARARKPGATEYDVARNLAAADMARAEARRMRAMAGLAP